MPTPAATDPKKKKKEKEKATLRMALDYLRRMGNRIGYQGVSGSYLESGAKKRKRYDKMTGQK